MVGGYGGSDECGVAVRYVSGAGGAYQGLEYYGWGGRRRVYGCTYGTCQGWGEGWELDELGGVQYLCKSYPGSLTSIQGLTIKQCDPEAAKSIFSNRTLAAKTTLIPLDLTHQVLATREVQQTLLTGTSFTESSKAAKDMRQMFHNILLYFAHTYSEVYGFAEGPPLHDPIAVAVLLEAVMGPTLNFSDNGGERWHVNIVTDGLHSRHDKERGQVGRTVVTKSDHGGVRIPRNMVVESFWRVLNRCLEAAERAVSD